SGVGPTPPRARTRAGAAALRGSAPRSWRERAREGPGAPPPRASGNRRSLVRSFPDVRQESGQRLLELVEPAFEKVVGARDLDDPGGVGRPPAQHFGRTVDILRADDEEGGDLRERERFRRLRSQRNADADEGADPRISRDRAQSRG